MTDTNSSAKPVQKYTLILEGFPSDASRAEVCGLLYGSQDRNLIAALSSTPYTIGRSFAADEAELLHSKLKLLLVFHEFKSQAPVGVDFGFQKNQFLEIRPELKVESKIKLLDTDSRGASSSAVPPTLGASTGSRYREMLLALGVGAVVLAVGLIAFFRHKSAADSSKESILNREATVEAIEHSVEMRRDQDLNWIHAGIGSQLGKEDSLRTFADSKAVLRYRSGSSLIVQPNTILIVGSKDLPLKHSVRLQDGDLQARFRSEAFSIVTSSGTIEVKGEVDTQIKTQMHDGNLSVAVAKGEVLLRPLSKAASAIEVKSQQKVTAGKDSISALEAYIPEINLIQPRLDANLEIDPEQSKNIVFEWEKISEASPATYEWRLSADPEMKTILLKNDTTSNQLVLTYLDIGTLYWQVSTFADGTHYQSSIWRINVKNSHR